MIHRILLAVVLCLSAAGAAGAAERRAGEAPAPPASVKSATADDPLLVFGEERKGRGDIPRGELSIRDYTMMILWLGVVLALVVGAAILLRRLMSGKGIAGRGRAVILERVALNPKQAIYLVGVGRRVLVVGASPDRLTALADIHDESEVAKIIEEPTGGGAGGTFDRFLNRAAREAGGARRPEGAEPAGRIRQEIDAIRRKMSSWTGGGASRGDSGEGRS
ncbi:MAG: flagellar biosynthetic protein FliO [Planctomycetota bacterium]